MSNIRIIPASLDIKFELDELSNIDFLQEFNSIIPSDEDPLGAWLKRVKSRGDTKESDQVMLTLLVELHRKLDELSDVIKNEQKQYIDLAQSAKIDGIGFEHIRLSEPKFEPKRRYYARILMPIFPKRNIAMYLNALDKTTAYITNMHEEDVSDWDAYVTSRERVMIRELRANS
ncbi:hypothetical protein CCAL9344_02410 [Campylobacter sp. RM9344]|uniref:Uncharacterized protein n=1 Tax=Campylobacter californiensis TaxID=1032243 RepID=A0AAW3ZUL1_9BACT|nr:MULTISPECIES: hypothetical protein [unclassified Campylobacter]MBE2984582.1 hypothetical protein [Campylobacter sp. RM6883]MBE2987049.1 hypothetical protein [Campylobacter sp. RM12919]MBE2988664.1 hypothetical protein [Campylobacter sp. RM12920]MBE2995130.1 hypothetical protein [Campylobacter sp. RM6913]MBE3021669.1 hypothetical protein [Campylobacter sp. 7477a]MBE3029051.1 hypothetical protein [Campylobacter sp. RM9344]